MQKKLWEATISQKENSNLRSFEKFLINKYNFKSNKNYKKLLKWSLQNPNSFWSDIWDFAEVKGVKSLKNKFYKKFTKNQFLVNSKLNFAENLLVKNNNKKAITFISENGFKETRSWIDLKKNVEDLATFFKKHKIKKGVRVAAYMPNQIETVECFLATAAIGAIWSSCSPDFGTPGLIERFSQIKPKILILTDRYYYNGKEISILERLPSIVHKIKSIKYVLIFSYPGKKLTKISNLKNVNIFTKKNIVHSKNKIFKYEKFDFNDDLVISLAIGSWLYDASADYSKGSKVLNNSMLAAFSSTKREFNGNMNNINSDLSNRMNDFKSNKNVDKTSQIEFKTNNKNSKIASEYLWLLK